jgi:hypothetical protein
MANEYGNYATLNPLYPSSNVTLSNGNLTATFAGSGHYHFPANMLIPETGKWALKATDINSAGRPSYQMIGVIEDNPASLTDAHDNATSVYWTDQGVVYRAGSSLGVQAATYTQNDVLEILYDRDAATLKLYKGGVLSYTVTSVPTTANVFSAVANEGGTAVWTLDFGQNGYTATDTDYLNLSTANLPTPAIINPADHFFSIVIDHDGSDTDGTCTFNLDTYEWLAIIKNTTGANENWYWINSIRGVNKYTSSNTSASEVTDANVLTVSGTTFTLGSTLGDKNYLVEIHKAGLASATASNEAGSINTTETSFNQVSGFVISEFEGTAGNATIGNPLDEALDFLIHRPLDISGIANNAVAYHSSLTSGTRFLTMGEAGDGVTIVAARETGAPQQTDATMWNSTAPTSSLISLGSNVRSNAGSSMMSYGWHKVSGYSDFGSYVHNASADGPFVNTGSFFGSFLTRHITDSGATQSSGWAIMDRNLGTGVEPGFNYNYSNMGWSIPGIASTAGSNGSLQYEFISNGMKIRRANSASGAVWMYCSWGGTPMQGDGAVNQGRAK